MPRDRLAVIDRFPKVRPPLPEKQAARHLEHYTANRTGSYGLLARCVLKMEEWMHRAVARENNCGAVLEVGAGTLNHVQFETDATSYDVVEPFHDLCLCNPSVIPKVRHFYMKLSEIPFQHKYDRVVSVATLEHLTNLPAEISLIKKVMKPSGRFKAGFPTEGGCLWGMAWRLTTAPSYWLRTGMNYSNVMKHEHVNTSDEIISICEHFFKNVKIRYSFGGVKHASFYTFIECWD